MNKLTRKAFFGTALSVFIVSMVLPVNQLFAQIEANNIPLVNPGFEEAGDSAAVAYRWHPFQNGYKRVATHRSGSWGVQLTNTDYTSMSGAYQRVGLNQSVMKPVFIGGYVKGEKIKNSSDGNFGAGLYAEIHLNDGSVAYWNSIANYGSFNWRWVGFNTGTLASVNKPISHIFVVPILSKASGRAYFDDIVVKEYDPSSAAITLMFDDGELTTYTEAKPVLDEYGYDASAAIYTDGVDKTGFMTWAQLKELQDSGWEIVSHGKTHKDLTKMSSRKAKREFSNSKKVLEANGLKVNNFAFPYGEYNGQLIADAAKYYKSTRLYEHNSNPYGAFPYDVKVRGTLVSTTPDEVGNWINEALANNRWIVLVFHGITNEGDDTYHTTPEDFKDIVKVVKDSGINVVTYDEGILNFATEK